MYPVHQRTEAVCRRCIDSARRKRTVLPILTTQHSRSVACVLETGAEHHDARVQDRWHGLFLGLWYRTDSPMSESRAT